ncbi:prephenate dehydrogenase dimerization domain-containing protein [Rhodococcus sp. HNM0569]|uniref:prephenate dehydrogenase dimerization domain-containing protein n=1 Tax=Rhodococcus sp. HNM0569 TaxID=2716340 RepID=UPI00146E7903|nr:prephenate dehydrogenase dimerization domain-containing protein [Rhodococcus sp. HNM0569]NLU84734.1 prephenate dehydrogenase [Rhodococcus sp. HNM0569]
MGAATDRAVVVGGRGAVGAMVAQALVDDGRHVQIVDRAGGPAGTLRGDVTAPAAELAHALGAAGAVVLAVPEHVAIDALPVLDELLAPDTVLVETLSVKSGIAAALASWRRPALGVNPMFAPALAMAGRPVVATVHRAGSGVEAFLGALARGGARIERRGAAEHDRLAAATQTLPHASVLAFALALGELDAAGAAPATAPPPHRVLRAVAARVASGEPAVYRDIQVANPYAAQARRALRRALDELDAAAAAPPHEFTALTARARAALSPDLEQDRLVGARVVSAIPTADAPLTAGTEPG